MGRSFSAIASFGLFFSVVVIAALNQPVFAQDRKAIVAIPLISQLVQKSPEGLWSGPLIDVLGIVENQTQVPMELHILPFKRAVAMTKEGVADFGVFMESPKRNKIAMPIMKLGDALYVVVTLKDNPIQELSELSGKTVAKIRGGSEIRSLAHVPDIRFHYFNKHEDGVRLLLKRRVDALITADFRVLEAIERLHLSYKDISLPIPVEPRELWLYASWKSSLDFDVIRKVKNAPPLMVESLTRDTLFKAYKKADHN